MVVLDYSRCVEAIVIEERATSELPTTEDLLARKYSPTCLTFTEEAASLRTHFRDYVLQTVFELTKSEVGDALKTADVIIERDYEAPALPRLVLCLWADIDVAEWRRANRAVSKAVIKESSHWFEVEKEEYRKMIDFSLMMLEV